MKYRKFEYAKIYKENCVNTDQNIPNQFIDISENAYIHNNNGLNKLVELQYKENHCLFFFYKLILGHFVQMKYWHCVPSFFDL